MSRYSLFHNDCLNVLPDYRRESFDLILCDLPFGTTNNPWDVIIPFAPLWQEYLRLIKPNGAIVLHGQGLFTAKLIMSQPDLFKYKITWVKSKATNFLNAKIQPLRKHEDICVFYKSQPTYNPQMSEAEPYNKGVRKDQGTGSYREFKPVEVKSEGKRYPTDVVYFKTAESEGPVLHPNQKPLALCKYLISTYSNEGDTVLDNAMGVGSTIVAALELNRDAVGIEKEKEYYDTAVRRINHD